MPKTQDPILLVGDAESCPDITYFTGFRATDPVVYLAAGRTRHLVVPDLEHGRAERQARGCKVHTPATLRLARPSRRRVGRWAVGLARACGTRAVRVPATFPVGIARQLTKAGIRTRVEDDVSPTRKVKTADEIRKIAQSQAAAVAGMRAAMRFLRSAEIGADGALRAGKKRVTSEAVRHVINGALLARDCFCKQTIVAGGVQSADPHEPGSGPLLAGDPIVIDIFPQHLTHGYWGDITRTVVRGRPSPRLRAMYRAVKAAHGEALSRVKAGVRTASVHRVAAATLDDAGFPTGVVDGRPQGFFHSTGHGVGLEIHEGPSLGTGSGRLRVGHVVTIEPGLYYADIGGVRIEDTVVVTQEGCRALARCPTILALA